MTVLYRIVLVFILLPIASGMTASAQQISINEVMASNGSTYADEDGDFEDWIELYHAGDEPVNLKWWGLSDDDDVNRRFRFVFPDTTLHPGEFMLIWASGKDRSVAGEPLHAGFSISSGGEPIVLSDFNGNTIDHMPATEIPRDISFGRSPDGSENWLYFDHPTPGGPNAGDGWHELLQPPVFSQNGGFHPDAFDLHITPRNGDPDAVVLYTIDGSMPHPDHFDTLWYPVRYAPDQELEFRPIHTRTYNSPIAISDRSDEANDLSQITATYGSWHVTPESVLDKATTVRAAVYKNGRMGPAATHTYFVGPQFDTYRALPVFSIVTDETSLFSYETGISVPGQHFDYESGMHRSGNFMMRGREWERRVRGQLFLQNGELVLDQDFGLRIHGNTSRIYTNRSFRLYARADYGERFFEYPVFEKRPEQHYKRLKLRNSGQDIIHTYFRDALISTLMTGTHVDVEAYRPVQVFINGEYWGIRNLRERFDRYYVQERFGVGEQDVAILDHWVLSEDNYDPHYEEFRNFIRMTDPEDAGYFETAAGYIDPLSLFDLRIADIFFGRWDIHHWRIWRDSSREDSRWRWNMWDMDVGMGLPNNWGPEWTHGAQVDANYLEPFATDFRADFFNLEFRQLIRSPEGRQLFINRFADFMNTRYQAAHILEKIETMQDRLEPVIDEHILRWRPPNGITSKTEWYDAIGVMRQFAAERPGYVRSHIEEYFGLDGEAEISVNRTGDCGEIAINTLTIGEPEEFPWTGVYFSGNPVSLRAESSDGCAFIQWEVDGQTASGDAKWTVDPEPGMEVRAVFEIDTPSEPAVPAKTGLSANYPNPFNNATVIPFTLDSTREVDLVVYDIVGRKVETLASGRIEAGYHEHYWDAGRRASGVYVVVLTTGQQRFVQKVTLLK